MSWSFLKKKRPKSRRGNCLVLPHASYGPVKSWHHRDIIVKSPCVIHVLKWTHSKTKLKLARYNMSKDARYAHQNTGLSHFKNRKETNMKRLNNKRFLDITSHLHVHISYDFHSAEEGDLHYPSPLDKSNSCVSQWWLIEGLPHHCLHSRSGSMGCYEWILTVLLVSTG